jgi:hypothetical protein
MGVARPTLAALAVLALLGCSLFGQALFTGKVLAGDDLILFQPPFHPPVGQTRPANPYMFDAAWVFHPDMLFAREELRKFELPVWNPYQGAGQPLLASQQTAPLYPLNWIAFLFPFWHALAWIALLKVIVAGTGTFLFGRRLRLQAPAALLAAVSFAFSTYLIDWFAHPHSNVYVLLPWLMLAAHRVAVHGAWRDALLLAAGTGLSLLGGQPESSFLIFLPAAMWCLARGGSEASAIRLRRRAGLLVAGTALGVAIAAIVLLPFAEMLQHSQTASRSGGPGPWATLQSFLLPEKWGRPDKFELASRALNYPERTGYFGTLPLLLGAAGLVVSRRREQVFLLVIGLLALGLVVSIPVYSDLAAQLPGLSVINRIRALIVCCFCGAMLAGFGLQGLLEASRAGRRRLVFAALGGVTLPAAVWVAVQADFSAPLGAALDQLPVLGHHAQPAGVVQLAAALRWWLLAGVGAGLLAAAALRPRLATGVAIAVIAITALDLVSMDHGYIPAIAPAAANPAPPAAIRYAQAHAGHERVGGGPGLQPNMAERFGLRGARIHALPALEQRAQLWFELGGTGILQRLTSASRTLATLFSVRYVFTGSTRMRYAGTRLILPGLRENPDALPRAWFAYEWTPSDGARDSLRKIARTPDLAKPVIEGAPAPAPNAQRLTDPVRFAEDGDRTVVIDVRAQRPGFLVLEDTYYPGWEARVDGARTRVRVANAAFRAVSVPAGHHVVRFDYRPASVRLGTAISGLALLVLALGLALTRPRRRLPAPATPSPRLLPATRRP